MYLKFRKNEFTCTAQAQLLTLRQEALFEPVLLDDVVGHELRVVVEDDRLLRAAQVHELRLHEEPGVEDEYHEPSLVQDVGLRVSELNLSNCRTIFFDLFWQTLENSFSSVSKPNFATKETFDSS